MSRKEDIKVLTEIHNLSREEIESFALNVISWFYSEDNAYPEHRDADLPFSPKWNINKELNGGDTIDRICEIMPPSIVRAVLAATIED